MKLYHLLESEHFDEQNMTTDSANRLVLALLTQIEQLDNKFDSISHTDTGPVPKAERILGTMLKVKRQLFDQVQGNLIDGEARTRLKVYLAERAEYLEDQITTLYNSYRHESGRGTKGFLSTADAWRFHAVAGASPMLNRDDWIIVAGANDKTFYAHKDEQHDSKVIEMKILGQDYKQNSKLLMRVINKHAAPVV
jgi:hypothetical protein